MKVLLYLEGKSVLEKSGIGRALHHQMHALDLAGIPYTTDILGDYDVVHINTYGPRSLMLLHAAKRRGKKVIMHGHSTREDFENSFIGSNLMAPLFGKYLAHMYQKADYVITPSEYSKKLIQSYGVTTPIIAVSNGIDLKKYGKDPRKEEVFRDYFGIEEGQPVVICAGLYFQSKGIEDNAIPELIREAIMHGKVIGYQKTKNKFPREVYEVEFMGNIIKLGISISDNGFIVGANPITDDKEIKQK